MDIAGAKALRKRLGSQGTDGAGSASVDVPEDAPPVFHWVGVSNAPSDASAGDPGDMPEAERLDVSPARSQLPD
jgi:hypothetical protein